MILHSSRRSSSALSLSLFADARHGQWSDVGSFFVRRLRRPSVRRSVTICSQRLHRRSADSGEITKRKHTLDRALLQHVNYLIERTLCRLPSLKQTVRTTEVLEMLFETIRRKSGGSIREEFDIQKVFKTDGRPLKCYFAMYLADKDRNGMPVKNLGKYITEGLELLSSIDDGAQIEGIRESRYRNSDNNNLLTECATVISTNCNEFTFQLEAYRVAEFLEKYGREANQHTVGFVYCGVFHKIPMSTKIIGID